MNQDMDPSSQSQDEISYELLPFLRVYKDGRVERLIGSELVPPSPLNPKTSVSSKDIIINPFISARLYLPKISPSSDHQNPSKMPLFIYFHGSAFCLESAFSFSHQRYLELLVSTANIVVVSVNYRKAPEHPLPIAYEDCWSGLQWVLTHLTERTGDQPPEPWLVNHADFDRIYLGGDSSGANIAHNIVMRAGAEKLGNIRGLILTLPFFWGSEPIGSEPSMDPVQKDMMVKILLFANPTAVDGVDDPRFNPIGPTAPSLSGLACSRVLVFVAGNDVLKERGKAYVEALKKSSWKGEVELLEIVGEGHAFHVKDPESENGRLLINGLASFINN